MKQAKDVTYIRAGSHIKNLSTGENQDFKTRNAAKRESRRLSGFRNEIVVAAVKSEDLPKVKIARRQLPASPARR
jgi:hypothetical protein